MYYYALKVGPAPLAGRRKVVPLGLSVLRSSLFHPSRELYLYLVFRSAMQRLGAMHWPILGDWSIPVFVHGFLDCRDGLVCERCC